MSPMLLTALIAGVGVIVALAFVVLPLWRGGSAQREAVARREINIAIYRDQLQELMQEHTQGLIADAQYAAARAEIEARLAEDALQVAAEPRAARQGSRRLALAIAVVFPLAAGGLYALFGNPQAIQPPSVEAMRAAKTAEMMTQLEQKVRADTNNPQGWLMLGSAYSMFERWSEAAEAYGHATRLAPDSATAWAHLAEVKAILQDRKLDGEPRALLDKALKLDPKEQKALELAGIDAYQSGRFAEAARHWQALLAQLPPDSAYARDIAGAVDDARQKAGQPPLAKPKSANGAGAAIDGSIEIAPALAAKVSEGAALFVFARGGEGPPLAASRLSAKFPQDFHLDDTQAMTPERNLSSRKTVDLVVRLSRSGQPKPMPGDLEGHLSGVAVGAKGVKLVIDTERK
jgi:cytochrome c-type biogenesis protein CcmH